MSDCYTIYLNSLYILRNRCYIIMYDSNANANAGDQEECYTRLKKQLQTVRLEISNFKAILQAIDKIEFDLSPLRVL